MNTSEQSPPKVFISYAHATQTFADKVLNFANTLRTQEYIDADIDQYEESPAQGWPRWMEEKIRESDYVLVICTKDYIEKVNNYAQKKGKGVNWEVSIIYQSLYDTCCDNTKFIPILFEGSTDDDILLPLKGSTFYHVDNPDEFRKLCNRLKGIPNVVKPSLGSSINPTSTTHPLAPKSRKTLFVSSFIDIEEWNNAKWKGVVYAFAQNLNAPTIMCLLYENRYSACKIFSDWKKELNGKPFNDLDISIIQDSNGYYAFISTNLDRCIKRMEKIGIPIDNSLMFITSRYQFMIQDSSTPNLELFKSTYSKFKKYYIAPAYLKDPKLGPTMNNIAFDDSLAIEMNNVKFIDKKDITPNDIEYSIIKSPLN